MYISELKIHGFKSFANKENLHFGEGITVVVGPNGCGKTNIVDAIRWVLGEQKHSVLRSSKMEDIIFNGAVGLKPLSVCEVSLIVHNNQGKLPIEYNDVEIGRRIYRNGESEYFINKTPCRRKDIYDLFIDTGMGTDAYSVIELKMIEQILSESGDDRKRLFEEAAGINKYKAQRRSTLRKFDATRLDMERIKDIIAEVETKVHALNLQLKRFKRHESLSEKLKTLDIAFAYMQVQRYEKIAKPIKQKIKEYRYLRETKSTDESRFDEELDRLKATYQEQGKDLGELQNKIESLELKKQQKNQDHLVWIEQKRSSRQNIGRMNLEKQNNLERKEQAENHQNDYQAEMEKMEPVQNEKLFFFKSLKFKYENIDAQYQSEEKTVKKLQSGVWISKNELNDYHSKIQLSEQGIASKKEQTANLKTKIAEMELANSKLSQEQEALDISKKSLDKKFKESHLELELIEKEMIEIQEKKHQSALAVHTLKTRIESTESQQQFYSDLISSGDGFSQGVREYLENKSDYPGIIGPVADILIPESKFQLAIESCLGDASQYLLADNYTSAMKNLKRIQGKVSIIPLKEISAISTQSVNVPEHDLVISKAVDVVKYPKDMTPLAALLLGSFLIVKDLEKAVETPELKSWHLVDIKGVSADPQMILKNSGKSDSGSVLGRKAKIESLAKNLTSYRSELDELNKSIKNDEEEIKRLELNIRKVKNTHQSLGNKVAETETNIIKNHYAQSQGLENIKNLGLESEKLHSELDQLYQLIGAFKPKLEEKNIEFERLNTNIVKAEEALLEIRNERGRINEQVQDTRIELLNLDKQRETLLFQKRTAQETIIELDKRDIQIQKDVESLELLISDLENKIDQAEYDIKNINDILTGEKDVLNRKKDEYNQTFQSIETLQQKIRTDQRDKEIILEELKECELQINETKLKMEQIRNRIQENYHIPVPGKLDVDQDEESLELEIQRIRKSIESIGPINMAVQLEYEDESTRLNHLNEQRDDLIEAEENIRETIQKIDRVARKQFLETFEKIKYNFEKLFNLYFEGGSASINLIGDPDPLEANIGISVQPPGKRNQSLRMMSAGEKSLTAIALLFAIYQYKPSPFCILDEVDAPLDDVNIRKFTKVINSFSQDTQFIVVTHNKLTMESADYMYGVTMEEKGVSKIVSVKF